MSTNKTGWTGWIYFAGITLIISSIWGIITGLSAIFNDDIVLFTSTQTWILDLQTWGWIHLVVSLLSLWAAFSLLNGGFYGRFIAIAASTIWIITSMMFIPVYPFWSIIAVIISFLVLYAVIVHGNEMKS